LAILYEVDKRLTCCKFVLRGSECQGCVAFAVEETRHVEGARLAIEVVDKGVCHLVLRTASNQFENSSLVLITAVWDVKAEPFFCVVDGAGLFRVQL